MIPLPGCATRSYPSTLAQRRSPGPVDPLRKGRFPSRSPGVSRIHGEVGALQRGVFDDGVSFLTGRALALFCGIDQKTLREFEDDWANGDRDGALARTFVKRGFTSVHLYRPLRRRGVIVHAYPDDVCILFLDWYAYESKAANATALNHARKLMQGGLRVFVYSALGYDPRIPPGWSTYLERLQLNATPRGAFCVFLELAPLARHWIQQGLPADDHTVPDISVGQAWAKHWKDSGLQDQHALRVEYLHRYPPSFPQAQANGRIRAWAYPDSALGAFRAWLEDVYLPHKFPTYLEGKVASRVLDASRAQRILAASAGFAGRRLEAPGSQRVLAGLESPSERREQAELLPSRKSRR